MSSTTVTAKLKASSDLKNTGITPGVGKEFRDKLGRTRIAIVELQSVDRGESLDDKQSVSLEATMVEPVPDGELDEFLRELARALYRVRNPQESIDNLGEDKPEDVLERIRAYLGAFATA